MSRKRESKDEKNNKYSIVTHDYFSKETHGTTYWLIKKSWDQSRRNEKRVIDSHNIETRYTHNNA